MSSATDEAFKTGVVPTKAVVVDHDDGVAPPGWAAKKYLRHEVTLTLPRPMQSSAEYWVQALGDHGQCLTGSTAAAWIARDAPANDPADGLGLGIRHLELIAPTIVQISTGDALDTSRFDDRPESIVLTCSDDEDFRAGRAAIHVGRRTRGDALLPVGWPYGSFLQHELFAEFDRPLKGGHRYRVDLNGVAPLTCGPAVAELAVSDACVNPAIKVNQVGYLPGVQKFAYYGDWMGTLGALDISKAPGFVVRDVATGKTALQGACVSRHRAGEKNEGVYHVDLSGENVVEMDLSALKTPGTYEVVLPGAGKSFAFRVGDDVYAEPFGVMMTGIFHQRCGIELGPPWTPYYRPACHRDRTELADLVHTTEADAFTNLPKHVIDPHKYDLFGGHHDAGDFNPRSHIEVAELAFMMYEIHPGAFFDGQQSIPESRNGIPDVLDEGRWALDLFVRLQDADGGVRGGIESDGDPDQTTRPQDDPKRDFAFAKDAKTSLRFAASAAEAAILWNKLGKADDATEFLKHAKAAWDWSATHGLESEHDSAALAAIQLYRATGDKIYLDAFAKHCVFNRLPDARLQEWDKYDQLDASFYYALCDRPTDPTLKKKILDAYRNLMTLWLTHAKTNAYRILRDPYAPNTWGAAAHPKFLVAPVQAAVLLKDPEYRQWIALTCDYALGCNPMNTVFTTRLGQRSIVAPLHLFNRYVPDGPIPGLQCEGPSPRVGAKPATKQMGSWIDAMLFPAGEWPTLYTYSDVGMVPEMNEGVLVDQMRSAFAYGYLLPEASAKESH